MWWAGLQLAQVHVEGGAEVLVAQRDIGAEQLARAGDVPVEEIDAVRAEGHVAVREHAVGAAGAAAERHVAVVEDGQRALVADYTARPDVAAPEAAQYGVVRVQAPGAQACSSQSARSAQLASGAASRLR